LRFRLYCDAPADASRASVYLLPLGIAQHVVYVIAYPAALNGQVGNQLTPSPELRPFFRAFAAIHRQSL
jgi:hypothetical protein